VSRPRRYRGGDSIPAHPYRDAAIIYGVMAIVIVVFAVATGGNPAQGVLAALAFFVLAMGWSSWRFHMRIKNRDAAGAGTSGPGSPGPGVGTGTGSGRSSDASGIPGRQNGKGRDDVNGRGETP